MDTVLASGNPHKVTEIQTILKPLGIHLIPQTELGVSSVDETGLSFVENAIIKAKQSDGYIFSHWSSDTYTGIIGGVINTGHSTSQNTFLDGFAYTSLTMRCYDSKTCPDDIIINAHFVKED
mgnify:CR=1 FL=1